MARYTYAHFLYLAVLVSQIMISECLLKKDYSEKQALLTFKQGLIDPSNFLSSWVSEEDEWCEWDGIVCDNITGHVTELRLGYASLSGKITSSLLNLKHLTHLNLSYNDFDGIQIRSFLGSLVSLTYLDLTYAGSFVGMLPSQLGHLSNLHHLSIGSYNGGNLNANNLDWLSHLPSLELIDLRGVNLSKASNNLMSTISNLSSLLQLRLSWRELHHVHLPYDHLNLTSIQALDLSGNTLEGPLMCRVLKTFPNLRYLSLRSASLKGVIPSVVTDMTYLVSLDLSNNSLQGNIPSSLGSLCYLNDLDLSSNNYAHKLQDALESFSGCMSKSLTSLKMVNNFFSGKIPNQIAEFKSLTSLALQNNKLSGPIPVSLGSLSNLRSLEIYSNNMTGIVSEAHFSNLTNLKSFDASRNSLTLRVALDWIPPFHLDRLDLSHWNLDSQFPMWLKSQKNIRVIALTDTKISGVIPSWLWNLSSQLETLLLSSNNLSGTVPDLLGFRFVRLCSNKFTGALPRITSELEWLNLSNNSFSGEISVLLCNPMANDNLLKALHLGGNFLAGNIPNCWRHWPKLRIIDLESNYLGGEIPSSMGVLYDLVSLSLGNNSLIGEIPTLLKNCSQLEALILGQNKLIGMVPRWISSLPKLNILVLRSNKLNGQIPVDLCLLEGLRVLDVADNNLSGEIPRCLKNAFAVTHHSQTGVMFYDRFRSKLATDNVALVTKGREHRYESILYLVTSIDLSRNNLSGEIPEELASLKALRFLNLSRNSLSGSISNRIGNMTALESLDISWNKLSGEIPVSMSKLTFLAFLNLSCNALSGEIPKSTQLQSLNSSSFVGNRLLCGDPLPKRCGKITSPALVGSEDGVDGEACWFGFGVGVGFVFGFLSVIVLLMLSGYG